MIPTLRKTYTKQQRQLLEMNEKNIILLREAIDQGMLDQISDALQKVNDVMKSPGLNKLVSLTAAVQQAHKELTKVLSAGAIKSWATSTFAPKGFTAIGKLVAFTTSITRLFQQLPKIVNIAKGGMGASRQAEWDETKPIQDLIDSDTRQQLIEIMVKSMRPEGLSGRIFGVPYIEMDRAASEILELSFKELAAFSDKAKDAPAPKTDTIDSLAQQLKSKIEASKEEAEAAGDESKAGASAEQTEPGETAKQAGATKQQKAAATPKPTVSYEQMKGDLRKRFEAKIIELKKAQPGDKLTSNIFIPKLIDSVIEYLQAQEKQKEPTPKGQ